MPKRTDEAMNASEPRASSHKCWQCGETGVKSREGLYDYWCNICQHYYEAVDRAPLNTGAGAYETRETRSQDSTYHRNLAPWILKELSK